jgi:hypothetical protein
VVVVVGVNLGFRCMAFYILLLHSTETFVPVINLCLVHYCCNCRRENLGVWKKWYLRKVRVGGLTVVADKSKTYNMSLERQDEDENRYADVK